MIFELILTVCISAVNPSHAEDYECAVFREQIRPRECFYRMEKYNTTDTKYKRGWIELPREYNGAVLMKPARCKDLEYRP